MTTNSKKRILLKLSGETLCDAKSFGLDAVKMNEMALNLQTIHKEGFELGIVIGGGNFYRGVNLKDMGLARSSADQIGMLATLMNGVALQQALLNLNLQTKLLSALDCPKVAESYTFAKTQEYLNNNFITIFVGGTGNPYFTTDTAAALRACEIKADFLMKATKVAGVYNKDPIKFKDAKRYESLTYSQFIQEKLEVMDTTAIALCMNNKVPICVFDMKLLGKESINNILKDTQIGTIIN